MIRDVSSLFSRIKANPLNNTEQLARFVANYENACDTFRAAPNRYGTAYMGVRVDKLDPNTQELTDVTTALEAYPADAILIKSIASLKRTLFDMRNYLDTLEGDNDILESMAVEVSGMISDITGILQ